MALGIAQEATVLNRFTPKVKGAWGSSDQKASGIRMATGLLLVTLGAGGVRALAQDDSDAARARASAVSSAALRSHHFMNGRVLADGTSGAAAMASARRQQAAMVAQQAQSEGSSNLSAAWTAVGPARIASLSYGDVTGRVTSVAIDPADATGNTVYVGTTGGGVWKSTNAAGAVSGVTFSPLTDTLPVFSANAAAASIPSLSIGAISVNSGVILAGTGDPNDATDSFYGGGILRSADGGLTWTLIDESLDGAAGNHSFTGLGFAGFAWSSASPGTVVAAVSQAVEGTLVNAPNTTDSVMGLYYSTDAGVTWQMSVIMDGSQTVQMPLPSGGDLGGRAATAVVWNPVRKQFYAAVRYHGYYASADGVTWSRLLDQPGAGLSLAKCPTAPGTTGSVSCPIFRGALAVQPESGDTFALTVDANDLDQGLWQDACAIVGSGCSNASVTFSKNLGAATFPVGVAIPQGAYDLALAATPSGTAGPTQDTLLFAGTMDLYRCSLNGGCVFRNTTNDEAPCDATAQVAPAQHAIATLSATGGPLLYLGNDGGLWRSTDGVNVQGTSCSASDAAHFQNLNAGLGSLAEVVSFAQDPTNPATLLVGVGVNGSAGTGTASTVSTAWPQLSAGEGGTVAIDQSNPRNWYLSTAAGVSLRECGSGSSCSAADFAGTPTIGASNVDDDDSLINAPWLLDPALSSNVVIGTCRVWRGPGSSGAAWSSANAISKLLGGPQNEACSSANPVVRSLAAGGSATLDGPEQNEGSEVIYAGMAGSLDGGGSFGGHLFSTAAANTATSATAWTDLATSPVSNAAGRFNAGGFDLSSVAVDPHDATGATVYATVMGFTGNGINAPHLYRSVDGGAVWTNISSNLPNAPANSVVVDPNDANTIYVAMDTGVYVTSTVTSCSTANCWSVYGTGLPNAPVVELESASAMSTGDGRTGELRAATYGRGIWQIPLLTAVAPLQPAMTLSPTALIFGAQAVGTASAAQTVTVTNTGSASLTVSSIATSGDFSETDTCTAAIGPSLTCAIKVTFLPSATGNRSGLLTVFGNVAGGQATVSLTGNASAGTTVILTPVALSFPSTVIGATSAVENIAISNTGSSAVAMQAPVVAGDFAITANTCGVSLGAGVGCTVSITFAPTASGARAGSFTITDSVGTQTASLAGVGSSPATDALSPLALTFGAQQITTSSAAQPVVLTNAGDLPLTLISAQITSGDFTAVNACGNSLNPHSSCSIEVAFQPKNIGSLTGVMSVSDQYRTQTVLLNGVGIALPGVSLAPFSTVSFPNTGVGTTSAAQTVTLTNNGGGELMVNSIAVTGDFSIVAGSNRCGLSLAQGADCTLQVVFAPAVGGPRTGALTVSDNAPNSPQALQLTGAGVDFQLAANGSTSVTISNGENAVFPLLLSSAANVPGTVIFTCTGAPLNATCNVTPASVALGAPTTISVTVLTGVAGSTTTAMLARRGWLAMVATVFPLGLLTMRRRRLPRLAGGLLLCLLMAGSGCGVGREIPPSSLASASTAGALTPAGTYPIVVSANSAGITRSVTLTLVVQ